MRPLAYLLSEVQSVSAGIYADDVTVWSNARDISTQQQQLQKAIDVITNFLDRQGLQVSPEKTEFVVVLKPTNHSKQQFIRDKIQLAVRNTPIQRKENIKILGIIYQQNAKSTQWVEKALCTSRQTTRVLRKLTSSAWGLSEGQIKRLAQALVHSRFLYGLPFLPITPTQLDKIECINKTCLRIATGLPKYAKVEDLYGTGLLLPIGDCVEPALQAQNERLKLTNAGRTIRNALGLSNADLPQILPTIPPWEDITVTDNRPLPKHMNQASDKQRRDYYAQRHIQFLKSISADEDIIYTDASCTLEGSNTGAYLNLRTGEASSFFITHSCLLPEAAEGHAISEALAHCTQPGSSPKAVHIFTDSQQVIQTLHARSKIPAYARRILNYAAQLHQRSIRVRIHWIPGHTNIPGNDLVHQRALQHHSKEQLEDDSSKQPPTPFQDDTHEANYRAKVLRRRKVRAKLEEATKHNAPPPGSTRLYEITMRRLQTQSFTTIPVLHKMYPTTYCDPNCDTCQVPATLEHILWECPIHESSRAAFTKRAQCTLPQLRRDEAETTHWILEDPLIKARLNIWRNALRTTVIPCPAITRTTSSPI